MGRLPCDPAGCAHSHRVNKSGRGWYRYAHDLKTVWKESDPLTLSSGRSTRKRYLRSSFVERRQTAPEYAQNDHAHRRRQSDTGAGSGSARRWPELSPSHQAVTAPARVC